MLNTLLYFSMGNTYTLIENPETSKITKKSLEEQARKKERSAEDPSLKRNSEENSSEKNCLLPPV